MKLISILKTICFLVLLAMPAALANGSSIYIAAQANGSPGTGTQADPFDGSTQVKFDALMLSIPANTQIFLGAGTFMTNGFDSFAVKPGWVIQGVGMGKTILKLAGHASVPWHKHYHLAGDSCDNVHISNLTCDGNYQGYPWATHEVVGGVSPFGSNVVIDSIEVINCYGDVTKGYEEFSILIGGPNSQNITANCVIKNCLTHNYAPGANYTNGPMISYCKGAQILNCTDDGSNHGFGFSGDVGAKLQGCTTSRQTADGFYTDTAGNDQITIDGNSFSSFGIPIQFNSQSPETNVTISNNALETSNSTGSGGAAIVLSGASGNNFTITGNVFTYTGTIGSGLLLNNSENFTDLDIENNSSNVGLIGVGGLTKNVADVGVVEGNNFNQPIASLTPPAESPDSSPVASEPSNTPAPTAPDNNNVAADSTESTPAPVSQAAPAPAPAETKTASNDEDSPEQLANQIQNDTSSIVQRSLPPVPRPTPPVAPTPAVSSGTGAVSQVGKNVDVKFIGRGVFDFSFYDDQTAEMAYLRDLMEETDRNRNTGFSARMIRN